MPPNPFYDFQAQVNAVNAPPALDTAPAGEMAVGPTPEDIEAQSPFGRYQKYLDLVTDRYMPLMEAEAPPLSQEDRWNLFAVALSNPGIARDILRQRADDESDRRRRNQALALRSMSDALALGNAEREAEESDRNYELRLMDFDERSRARRDAQSDDALRQRILALDLAMKQEQFDRLRASGVSPDLTQFPGASVTRPLPGGGTYQFDVPKDPETEIRALAGKLVGQPKDALGNRYSEEEALAAARRIYAQGGETPSPSLESGMSSEAAGPEAYDSPEAIREAYQNGDLSREEARALLQRFSASPPPAPTGPPSIRGNPFR